MTTKPQLRVTAFDEPKQLTPLAGQGETKTPIKPIVKWAGSKRQLLAEILARLPNDITHYCEPFAGGLAVGLGLQAPNIIINDANRELVNVYAVVKHEVEALIVALRKHENTKAHFYAVRERDRTPGYYTRYSNVERAARLLFLNKTCFNGLYRVNQQGEFNAPFGDYKNPDFINAPGLRALHAYLNQASVQLCGVNAVDILDVANIAPKTVFFLDPPYMPMSQTASFTGYTPKGFDFSDQERVYQFCLRLHYEGHYFLLSNAAHPAIINLYRDFQIETVTAKRNINCHGDKRGNVNEVLISNYDANKGLLSLAPKMGEREIKAIQQSLDAENTEESTC